MLDRVLVPLPPLPEQRAIAHILGTLDDKIELNRRMSETLKQMARALFKAWFMDFEPIYYVRAETTENNDEPFEKKMKRLVVQLRAQQAEAAKLDAAIAANLKELGF